MARRVCIGLVFVTALFFALAIWTNGDLILWQKWAWSGGLSTTVLLISMPIIMDV